MNDKNKKIDSTLNEEMYRNTRLNGTIMQVTDAEDKRNNSNRERQK